MIEEFLRYIQFEKRFSPHTQQAYAADLEQFRAYIQHTYPDVAFPDLTHFHIRAWMVFLVQEGIAANSIRRKVSTLKSFVRFLRREGLIAHNPMTAITTPKVPKRLPVVVPAKKMNELLNTHGLDESFEAIRDRVAVELLYQTGLRRAELIALTDAQVDLNSFTIRVLGKGNKERLIPISRSLVPLLIRYRDMRAGSFPDKQAASFMVTDKGQEMYPGYVYKLVQRFLASVPGMKKRSPHVLRHSFATHLLEAGADINAIKDLLGHTNLAATQIYTQHNLEKLRQVYGQAHPKGGRNLTD